MVFPTGIHLKECVKCTVEFVSTQHWE